MFGVTSGQKKDDKKTWWWNDEVQERIQKEKWDSQRGILGANREVTKENANGELYEAGH